MIVPHSSICTDRMTYVLRLLQQTKQTWISTYDIRPAKLFNGVDQRLAIVTFQQGQNGKVMSSRYIKWNEEARQCLFDLLRYTDVSNIHFPNSIPKIETFMEVSIWNKVTKFANVKSLLTSDSEAIPIYFHNAPRYWIRAMNFAPYFWNERGGEHTSTQLKRMLFQNKEVATCVGAALNGSLFYWWFVVLSDCRHLNSREIDNFGIGIDQMGIEYKEQLQAIYLSLIDDLQQNSKRTDKIYKTTGRVISDEFYPRHSKHIIDEIDRVLAKHYGFTEEELDFIINFDIKYRMGRNSGDEDED